MHRLARTLFICPKNYRLNINSLSVLSHSARPQFTPRKHLNLVLHSSSLIKRTLSSSIPCLGKLVQFTLSDPGEGIREVVIKKWFVKVGAHVAQFEPICEVESDKATTTITSRFDGKVSKLYYEVEQTATVGKPLVDIELEENQQSQAATATQPVTSPSVSQPPPPPPSSAPSSAKPTSPAPAAGAAPGLAPDAEAKVLATPAVRRVAHEHKVNLALVRGTGKDGRVLKEDVFRYVEELKSAPARPPAPTPAPTPAPVADKARTPAAPKQISMPLPPSFVSTLKPEQIASIVGQNRFEPLRGVRKSMYKSMTAALAIPSFGFMQEVDMTTLATRKAALKELFAERGLRFTYMPWFIKAASLALHRFPILNSSIDEKAENIIYKASHNIGLAVDTPNGLVVPNIKHVQLLNLFDIASELSRKVELAMTSKLAPIDVSGGTFTLSNIGNIGGTYTIPVILPPEVVIGGIGQVRELPRFDEKGAVRRAHIMSVSWSGDHRVVDGATLARFATLWKSYLEQPDAMLAEMR